VVAKGCSGETRTKRRVSLPERTEDGHYSAVGIQAQNFGDGKPKQTTPMMLINKSPMREFRPPIKAITSRDVDVIDGDIGRISKVKFL
jgi:hypothetical protein